MASISTVQIEVELKGQRQVASGLKKLSQAQDGLNRGIKASVDTNNKGAKSLERILREAQRAQREMDKLSAAVRENNITQNQFLGESNKIAARLKNLGMANARSEVMKYAYALNQARDGTSMLSTATTGLVKNQATNLAHVQQTKRQTNQLGVVFQQAGYQVGDFAVQVQSGTNVMVALGQQLTQLVGVGAMLARSTKWIAAFSALGVIVPITTAIVGGFMRANGSSSTFKDTLDELKTSVDNYKSAMDDARKSTSDLRKRFGSVTESMRPFLNDLQELERIRAVQNLSAQFEKLDADTSGFIEKFGRLFAATTVGGAAAQADLASQLDLNIDQYDRLLESVNNLKEAETSIERIKSAEALRDLIKGIYGTIEAMPDDMKSFYEQVVKTTLVAGDLEANIDGSASESERLAEGMSQAANEAARFIENLGKAPSALENSRAVAARLQAQLNVLQGGGGEERAARAGARAEILARPGASEALMTPAGRDIRAEIRAAEEAAAQTVMNRRLQNQISDLTSPSTDGGGAGRGVSEQARELERVQKIFNDLYDSSEAYRGRLTALQEQYQSGQISIEQYREGMEQLKEAISDGTYVLESAQQALIDYAADATKYGDEIADALTNAFQGAEDALTEFVTTGKLDFQDLANSILADISRIAIRSAILGPISSSLGGLLGGGGGGGGLGSLFSGIFHNGGIVGAGGNAGRQVSAAAFIGAPRYHDGGIAGLRPNEVPAILERGERIIPKKEVDRGRNVTVNMTINTPDANSFRRSENQVASMARMALQRAERNM